MYLRSQLKKISVAILVWRLLKKLVEKLTFGTRYYVPRLIGRVTYPILGDCVPLRGYHKKTRDYLKCGNGQYIELDSPCKINKCMSDVFVPKMFVAVIPGGRSLYDYGVVVSPDHKLLGDVSWEGYGIDPQPLNHPAMYALRLPPIRHIAGRVAVITSLGQDNYYHWMFDILPRFQVIRWSGLVPDRYIVNAMVPFQRESLQMLNIPSDKILSPTKNTHIEADELIVPSLPGPVYNLSPQPQACEYLRSSFLKDRTQQPRRALYISRADANGRRVVNESEIQAEVINNGFEVLSLSNLSFRRQIELFSEAKIIIGPHGAGLTNTVFCQRGSVVIEFMPKGREIDCFERLARIVGLEYHSIGSSEGEVRNSPLPDDDYIVDPAVLHQVLRQCV